MPRNYFDSIISIIALYPFPERITFRLDFSLDSSEEKEFLQIIEKMGVESIDCSLSEEISLSGGNFLDGLQIDCCNHSKFLPILVVLGVFCNYDSRFYNLSKIPAEDLELIEEMFQILSCMGVQYTKAHDSFFFQGPQQIMGFKIENVSNLKIAKSLVVAGLYARTSSELKVISSLQEEFDSYKNYLDEFVSE